MNRLLTGVALAAALAMTIPASHANAHGFAGKRFFPATLQTDDPFVADELSLPTVSAFKNGSDSDNPGAWQTDTSIDFSKRITPNFGIGAGETWTRIKPDGSTTKSGFNNLELSAKYLLLENDPHEFLLSVGLDAEIGGTGVSRVGADRFNTYTPTVFFGKGFGDLPDSVAYLKPFAVTGSIGYGIPSTSKALAEDGGFEQHPHTLDTGLAIEYNLGYLQSSVRDVGLARRSIGLSRWSSLRTRRHLIAVKAGKPPVPSIPALSGRDRAIRSAWKRSSLPMLVPDTTLARSCNYTSSSTISFRTASESRFLGIEPCAGG